MHPIVFFEITCRDAAPLEAFYSKVFGWSVTPHASGEYSAVSTGSGINGMITALPDDMPAALTVFVATGALSATLVAVEEAGGRLLFEPMDLPNGERVAMIQDPAGTTIGLIQSA